MIKESLVYNFKLGSFNLITADMGRITLESYALN